MSFSLDFSFNFPTLVYILKTLITVLAGSKLYGLDGPDSDTDYKSVHLPDPRDCVLLRPCRNSQSKSGKGADKKEHESFALQEFLKLAANGEDIVITMLRAKLDQFQYPESDGPACQAIYSQLWEGLHRDRRRFYTKHMRGAVGYAKSQCAKYGLRADRMETVEKVITALCAARDKGVGRLYQCWDDLPDGEHIVRTVSENNRDGVDKRIYEVAGKGLPATITPAYACDIMMKLRDGYGDRVRAAKAMNGKDLKALSHSFRVGYQLFHLYNEGSFSFPLPESDFIKDVKFGRLNYLDDNLDEKLNNLITQVEALAEASTLPEKVDSKWLDSIVLDAYRRVYNLELSTST